MQYQRPATQAYGGMPAAMPQASSGFASSPYYAGQQGAGASFASSQQPNFAGQQGMRPAGYGQAAPVAAPYAQPITSNVTGTIAGQAARPGAPSQAQPVSLSAQPGLSGTQNFVTPGMGQAATPIVRAVGGSREQALEQRIRELESVLAVKEQTIQELESQLDSAKNNNQKGGRSQARSPGRSGNGFRKAQDSKPVNRYTGVDGDDPIDVRLAEYYNSTGSAIQFRRINRGFYRFGDSIVELDIINHKLMARTEDGWNRGKFGPVEKFMMHYENIEREKAGVLPDFARNNC